MEPEAPSSSESTKVSTTTSGPSSSATHWSVVSRAGDGSSPEAREAFGELYTAFLPPLLAYLRGLGLSRDRAMDALQGFFEHLLASDALAKVERKGRFRSWLLRCLKHFNFDEWRKQQASKRAADRIHLPIGPEFELGEVDPGDSHLSPEQAYDRKWAIALLKRVLSRLADEYAQSGKQKLFEELKDFLPGGHAASRYDEVGARLLIKPNTVAVAVDRLRKRYAELLRTVISDTVDPDMVEDEWRHLQDALAGRPESASGDSRP